MKTSTKREASIPLRFRHAVLVAAGLAAAAATAHAAAPPAAAERFVARADEVNRGVVEIITAGVAGTYARIGYDLSNVLDNGKDLRVVPVLGKGSLQNMRDIIALRGIDIGIIQSDALRYVEDRGFNPRKGTVSYIAKLYNEEFHLIVGPDIHSIEDLRGKTVSFDVPGAGSNITTANVLKAFHVEVKPAYTDIATAIADLEAGRIAAIGHTAGKPYPALTPVPAGSGLHILPVPYTPELQNIYFPAKLTAEDYPNLVAPNEPVETVAVGAVLAVYNLQPGTTRYTNVSHFIDAFFSNIDKFTGPAYHPKWAEVNLAAEVPGWTRFPPAQAWLDQHKPQAPAAEPGLYTAFERFLSERAPNLDAREKDQLFQEFLQYQRARQPAKG